MAHMLMYESMSRTQALDIELFGLPNPPLFHWREASIG